MRKKYAKWALISTLITFALSFSINFLSEVSIKGSALIFAIIVLLLIIFIGVIFDIIGTAVTAADEVPFHSMAAQKVRGATRGIALIKSAERVSNICNDIVGDICGIISGSTTAALVIRFFAENTSASFFAGIILTAVVAAVTVGGKAFGKGIAISNSNEIVFLVAKILSLFDKENKNGKHK
ncbi:MAG: hypothetical protein Q8882_04795 [Bacillota bacterium]|nr:hypothetical protein [Bacillota bacterium]